MSKESAEWLNTQTLIGMTDKRGSAWHYRENLQGDESNHYPGAIPTEDVIRRLFHWGVVESPVVAFFNGSEVIDHSRKVIGRDDTNQILGVFKAGYVAHDYKEWLLDKASQIVDDSEVVIGSAGLLANGGQAWVQFEMPENFTVAGFEFRPFLGASTSLDGTMATKYFTGNQAIVCDNTLASGISTASTLVTVRHSKNSLGTLTNIREALGILQNIADDFQAEFQTLVDTSVSDAEYDAFLAELVKPTSDSPAALTRVDNLKSAYYDLWTSDPMVKPWSNTAAGVLQAVNTFAHHHSQLRGVDRVSKNMSAMVKGTFSELDGQTIATLTKVLARA